MNTVSATLNGDEDRRVFPAAVVQLVVVSPHRSKSPGQFSARHMPGLWVQSLARARAGGELPMFLSCIDVPLPLSLPFPLKSVSMSSGEDKKRTKEKDSHAELTHLTP